MFKTHCQNNTDAISCHNTSMSVYHTLAICPGASDDIRRATELAYRAVSEFGLSASIGPLAVASMGGSEEGSLMLKDSGEC